MPGLCVVTLRSFLCQVMADALRLRQRRLGVKVDVDAMVDEGEGCNDGDGDGDDPDAMPARAPLVRRQSDVLQCFTPRLAKWSSYQVRVDLSPPSNWQTAHSRIPIEITTSQRALAVRC
jgi:hypothetical protein